MNYCGRVTGQGFSGDFLKRALLLVPEDAPFRGPASYQEQEMSYTCRAKGDFDWFQGYEEIRLGDRLIYECFYHGGRIE
jgi:hypothetical protein